MANARGEMTSIIMRQVLSGYEIDEGAASPAVISCGGIYIPHRGPAAQSALYQIITTPSANEPVKVVTGSRPINILREVMVKESMN